MAPKQFFEVNVGHKKSAGGFLSSWSKEIHLQHCGCSGEIKNPPAMETAPYNPGDVYQGSKTEGKKLVIKFFAENKFPGVIFRAVGIYGPGDSRFLKIFR